MFDPKMLEEIFKGGMNITINNYNININIQMPSVEDVDSLLAWLDAHDTFESSEERKKLKQQKWEQIERQRKSKG